MVMNRSYSKRRHIQEANLRLEKRFLNEQAEQHSQIEYSVQQNPQTKKFRIFVVTDKVKTPTDALTVFGENQYWKDYPSQRDAQQAIESINATAKKQQESQPQTQSQSPQSSLGDVSAQGTGQKQSDFGEIS